MMGNNATLRRFDAGLDASGLLRIARGNRASMSFLADVEVVDDLVRKAQAWGGGGSRSAGARREVMGLGGENFRNGAAAPSRKKKSRHKKAASPRPGAPKKFHGTNRKRAKKHAGRRVPHAAASNPEYECTKTRIPIPPNGRSEPAGCE
jgi:hypothetical protein